MVSSEVASLARTGGLGDVVEALSRTLAADGADVVVVTPRYGPSRVPPGGRWWKTPVRAPLGVSPGRQMRVYEAALGEGSGPRPRVCMLEDAPLFDRDGIYGDARGGFADNALRFCAMSSGALGVAEQAWDGALPDVVHAHDWHGAPAIVYAGRTRGETWASVPTVLTIHNLAYQGIAEAEEREPLGLPAEAWDRGWARHEGRVNLLKAGIESADRVTTVSETYAREIQDPHHGHGLDAHLRWHASKLSGIVNGIDTKAFDPRSDRAIARRYGEADAVSVRSACKAELVAELGLDAGDPAPLFGVVSRLEWLKGIDLFLAILPALVARGARIVVEGTGARPLEDALRTAADRWPGRVASRVVFDPALARRIFAGADFLVVPSREEPCGLTQMYAMRYGAIPVVTPVGGLLDTVLPADVAHASGTGFVAGGGDAISLLIACEDAIGIWRDPIAMEALVARTMARDSSWPASARRYLELYASLAKAA